MHKRMQTGIHAYSHTCILAYMHTCIHAYLYTCKLTYLPTYLPIHACMHACILTYIHTDLIISRHTYIHTSTRTYFRSSMHACMHFVRTYMMGQPLRSCYTEADERSLLRAYKTTSTKVMMLIMRRRLTTVVHVESIVNMATMRATPTIIPRRVRTASNRCRKQAPHLVGPAQANYAL